MDDREKSNEELRKELGELKEAYQSLKALYEEGIAERRVAEAELSVRRVHDNIGNCHTLFECGKNEKLNVEHKY